MRAGRLLSILLLLQSRQRITAGELADRLEVSVRTIYRDLDVLSAAGLPVYAERGANGGCRLLDGGHVDLTALTGLTPDEAAVLAALPPAIRAGSERASARLHVDMPAFFRREEAVPFLPALLEATWNDRRIRVRYRRKDDRAVDRVLEPLGLVAKGGVWYLVAVAGRRPTAYRVSRFDAVVPTDDSFSRPADFDLAGFWSRWSAEFEASRPKVAVTVRVAPFLVPELPGIFGEQARGAAATADADGWSTIELSFESEESAVYRLMGLGTAIELVTPRHLRGVMARRAAELVEAYGPVRIATAGAPRSRPSPPRTPRRTPARPSAR